MVSPLPAGFHLAREPSGEAIARGSIAFACSWLPMAIVGLVTSTPRLAIPVAGPILAYRAETGLLNFLEISGIVIDVSVQVFGLFMATLGFAIPSKWLERDARFGRGDGER